MASESERERKLFFYGLLLLVSVIVMVLHIAFGIEEYRSSGATIRLNETEQLLLYPMFIGLGLFGAFGIWKVQMDIENGPIAVLFSISKWTMEGSFIVFIIVGLFGGDA